MPLVTVKPLNGDAKVLNAHTMEMLVSKVNEKFKIKATKFVLKSNGAQVDDNDVLCELSTNHELIALEEGQAYSNSAARSTEQEKPEIDCRTTLRIDGLPLNEELVVERSETIKNLVELVTKEEAVLVTVPPYSGKTCLFQLFARKFNTISISFATFRGETLEDLQSYFQKEIGKTIEQCLYQQIGQPIATLLTDETQNIYHIEEFWALFKKVTKPTTCPLLSFAVYGTNAPLGQPVQSPKVYGRKVFHSEI